MHAFCEKLSPYVPSFSGPAVSGSCTKCVLSPPSFIVHKPMLVLLSCAKTMSTDFSVQVPTVSTPRFEQDAREIAFHMAQCSIDELERLLRINASIATDVHRAYQLFHSPDSPTLPALLAYTGIVFKRLNPHDFDSHDFDYAQEHLRLTSFCYGLLRPLDGIKTYRLEGDAKLDGLGQDTVFCYWRNKLTDVFIADIRRCGGTLCNLASDEMRRLFDWERVEREVSVITPEFKVQKGDKLKTIVIYTKMCRGEMARFILKNRLTSAQDLQAFRWEGFSFDPERSTAHHPLFVG